jgi:hypothetical protein
MSFISCINQTLLIAFCIAFLFSLSLSLSLSLFTAVKVWDLLVIKTSFRDDQVDQDSSVGNQAEDRNKLRAL